MSDPKLHEYEVLIRTRQRGYSSLDVGRKIKEALELLGEHDVLEIRWTGEVK